MNDMKTSDKGLLEIAEHEGVVPAPYLDSVGIATYGIGHTVSAGFPNPSTMPRGMPVGKAAMDKAILNAVEVFKRDVTIYEKRVNKAIKVPISQHEFDALVSFDFNTGGIFKAKLTRQINEGVPEASKHFFGWLRPPELRKRRTAEKNLYDSGDYDANGTAIPIWKVDVSMRLRGQYGTMDGLELLEMMGRGESTPTKKPVQTATTSKKSLLDLLLEFLGVRK